MPRPTFHKLIVPATIQARQLRIPESFLRKFRDDLSNISTITLPSGVVWRIGLKKVDNKVWFYDGWQNFVEVYSIRVGYFLVFRYEGNSSFTVHIFNLVASEINYKSPTLHNSQGSLFANECRIFDEMEDEDPLDILGSLSGVAHGSLQNKALAGSTDQMTSEMNYGSSPALQNLFNGSKNECVNWGEGGNLQTVKGAENSTKDKGVQFNATEFKKSADEVRLLGSKPETPKTQKQGRKKLKVDPNGQETSAQHGDEAEMRFRFYESASARKRTVTAEERERAINSAKAFEPPNPFCRVVLRPSYLYRGCIMYLPSCFAEKNLNGVSGFIKLQLPDGRQWPVRCLYRSGRAKLSQGWYEFTLENNIGEGDVCVFELLKAKDVVLKVTVFRVVEEAALLAHPLQAHNS